MTDEAAVYYISVNFTEQESKQRARREIIILLDRISFPLIEAEVR